VERNVIDTSESSQVKMPQSGIKNDTLFALYRTQLVSSLRQMTKQQSILSSLRKLEQYFCGHQPTQELARGFLLQYATMKPSTRRFYNRVVKEFMNWYGDAGRIDLNVPTPQDCSVSTQMIEKLLQAIRSKRTHKCSIERDSLLIELTLETGVTRGELANLRIKDIADHSILIRSSKPYECRTIPLPRALVARLRLYSIRKSADAKLFGLKSQSVSVKIYRFARKAKLKTFRLSILRHKYAIDLFEEGATVATVQQHLGHKNISSTKVYYDMSN